MELRQYSEKSKTEEFAAPSRSARTTSPHTGRGTIAPSATWVLQK